MRELTRWLTLKNLYYGFLCCMFLSITACQNPLVKESDESPEVQAVIPLMEASDKAFSEQDLQQSEYLLERALRMAPQEPRLYGRLARVRLEQSRFEEAEQLTQKALSLAGNKNELKAALWRLIASIRDQSGNEIGSKVAIDKAKKLEQ